MSNLEAITLLDETTKRSSYPKIEVHAIAIFSILNNFMRRYSVLLHEYIYFDDSWIKIWLVGKIDRLDRFMDIVLLGWMDR